MTPRMRYVLGVLALGLISALFAGLGLSLYKQGQLTTLLWAPCAIGLAWLLLYGLRWWPGVLLGGLLFALVRGNGHVVVIGVVDTLEVVAEAALLLGVFRFRVELDRVRDVLALVGVAVTISMLAATIDVTYLTAVGRIPSERAIDVWSNWWWSHTGADLIIAPAILTWARRSSVPESAYSRTAEVVALSMLAPAVVIFVLGSWLPSWMPSPEAPYLLLPILIWAGLRFGPRGAALAGLGASVTGVIAQAMGVGPFWRLFDLHTFVAVSAVSTLTLSALVLERMRALERQGAIKVAALDGIVTIDHRGTIVEMNPAAERLFQIDCKDAIGRELTSLLVPPRLRDSYHRALRLLAAGEAGVGNRYTATAWRTADKVEFPVEVAVTRIPVEGEALFTGFVRDISAERTAAAQVRQAQEDLERKVNERTKQLAAVNRELERRDNLMREAEELAHLGSFDFDLERQVLKWSDELYRIYGRDDVAFQPTFRAFLEAINPQDRARMQQNLEEPSTNLKPISFEERICRPDGAIRVLQTQARVYSDTIGRPIRIIGCCQDITDRKQAEHAQFRLAQLVEQSDDAIIGLSSAGVIESWNAAATMLFGYSREQAIGMHANRLVPHDQSAELTRILEAVRAGRHVAHYEIQHCRSNGDRFDASVTTSAVLDADRRLIGISKVIRDVTARKQVEAQLRSSLHEKEILLQEIHHRVKNNLQVIASLLNIQVYSEASEEARKGLVESQNRIQSMALVHQLLYQSKDLAQIDVSAYLQQLVMRLQATFTGDHRVIDVTVSARPFRLDIDRAIPCGLIVNELVTNALTHGFPDGREGHVSVTLEYDADEVQLTVADDGIGISEPVRFDGIRSFGLKIARTLAQQLDGDITIKADHGTIAQVTFPVEPRGS